MMPVQKPGRSCQTYGTPWELIRAVEARWGPISIDFAASKENAKAPIFISEDANYLTSPIRFWTGPDSGIAWCNPPFSNIGVWAEKWQEDAAAGARIIALVPASVGSEWFANHVEGVARVVALRPRLTFEGCSDPYPKDCILLLYGRVDAQTSFLPGFETWRWR